LRENWYARVVRWMIGKDGFTGEAQKKMEAEGVYSSDPVQLRIIKDGLGDVDAASRLRTAEKIVPVKEFEVVLPSATKAELVAARAVEEIGTEMGFDEVAIGQMKAAVVEACINGFEHSRNKAAKVFLRFISSVDRLTIHIQNGGVDFDKPKSPAAEPAGHAAQKGLGVRAHARAHGRGEDGEGQGRRQDSAREVPGEKRRQQEWSRSIGISRSWATLSSYTRTITSTI
jgi:anti-sigma regulatory factor (Ser/Thr protein kinase)